MSASALSWHRPIRLVCLRFTSARVSFLFIFTRVAASVFAHSFLSCTYVYVSASLLFPDSVQQVYSLSTGSLFTLLHIHSCSYHSFLPLTPLTYMSASPLIRGAVQHVYRLSTNSLFTDFCQRVSVVHIYSCGCHCIRQFTPSFQSGITHPLILFLSGLDTICQLRS